MQKFEKISFKQFCKDVVKDFSLYGEYNLPMRSTINSAGYDFFSLVDFDLLPGEVKKIPLGVKVKMDSNVFLMLVVRSSMGFKYNVRLCNQVGIIDSDYYDNVSNEGHIWIALQNEGNDIFKVVKGDKIVQGIFLPFLIADDVNSVKRSGGIGSTDEGVELI
ncbi:MAG: hypothetical protein RSB72_01875 [Bacilli bacterium]